MAVIVVVVIVTGGMGIAMVVVSRGLLARGSATKNYKSHQGPGKVVEQFPHW